MTGVTEVGKSSDVVGVGVTNTTLVSPYFLHPSDNTGQAQSPILLNGDNYERWAKLVTNSLRAKRKVCFLDGTLKRPSSDSVEAEKWDMVNSMIIGWIYSSIEPKLRPSVSLVDSAKLMWDSLQRRFSVTDGTRVHQLRADLATCKQEGQSVESYFGKLKVLWDDLSDLESGFQCCCGDGICAAMVKYEQHCEKIRVHQFLMGLDNTHFGTSRSNLLSRESVLNLDRVYSQIVQEERHLNATRSTEERSAAVAFSTNSATAAAARPFTNKGTKCSHCNKTGHDVSNCFQLNGFPEWWNEKSGGRGTGKGCGEGSVRGRGRGSVQQRAYHAQTAEEAAPGIPNFTADQWKSLAQFMNSQKSGADEKLSGKREKLLIMEKQSRLM